MGADSTTRPADAGLAFSAQSSTERPSTQAAFPLEQAGRAHEVGEAGRTQGQLMLTLD